jgi:hypothetical protein
MAVDRGYGSGKPRSAANSAARRTRAASAGLRKQGIKIAGRKIGNTATASLKPLSGTSDYVAGENAARKQLGVSGQAARYRQLPTAARATARGLVREITGIDVSRRGVSVDPMSLAMALPIGKVLKAAKVLRAAGNIERAAALESRIALKDIGREIGKAPKRGSTPFDARYVERGINGTRFEDMGNLNVIDKRQGLSGQNRINRELKNSSSVYPRISGKERLGAKPTTSPFVEAYRKRKIKEQTKKAKTGRASSLLREYLPGLYD